MQPETANLEISILNHPKIGAARHSTGHRRHRITPMITANPTGLPPTAIEVCHSGRADVTIPLSGCQQSGYTATYL